MACEIGADYRGWLDIDFSRNGEPVSQHIFLEPVPLPFGGHRWYARCPMDGRRCTTLVMPNGGHRFASVKAWRLPYASQREDVYGRAHRKIAKANARLDRMSKYTRTPTRRRHWAQIEKSEMLLDYGLTLACARIAKVDARWARRNFTT